jgi:Family of unknown function (DUF6478)
MVAGMLKLIDWLLQYDVRLWRRISLKISGYSHRDLRGVLYYARPLHRRLSHFIRVSDNRLKEAEKLQPYNGQAVWRHSAFRYLLPNHGIVAPISGACIWDGCRVVHDCSFKEITVRQIERADNSSRSLYAISVETYHVNGSFFSVVFDLPIEVLRHAKDTGSVSAYILLDTSVKSSSLLRMNVRANGKNIRITRDILSCGYSESRFELSECVSDLRDIEAVSIEVVMELHMMSNLIIHDFFCTLDKVNFGNSL